MNRKISLLTTLLAACVVSFAFIPGNESNLEKNNEGTDILSKINEMNGPNMPRPGKEFKPGHISEAEIQNYLHKTDHGFVIKLPSNSNIPTPIVQDGKLFVSGGFGSKQYYAFDAKTGEKIWALNIDDDGPSSGVTEGDALVFNTESCTIFACDKNTGKYLWSHWLGDPLMSMPAVANGKVFTAYPAVYSYSYDEHNGMHTGIMSASEIKPTHVRSEEHTSE